MNNQLVSESFNRVLTSSIRMLCLLGIASIMLIATDDATAKSKKKEKKQQEAKEYIWPAPPSEPVIKFEREFNSEKALVPVKKSRWKDALLGKEDEKASKLVSPYSVHVDAQGRVLVADMNIGGLAVFDFEKKIFSIIGDSGEGTLDQPIAVATDRLGRIYVTDGRAQRVVVYDLNGKFLNNLGEIGEFERPVGVVVDNQRELVYIADTLKHDIRVFNFDGERVSIIGKRGLEPGEFNFPTSLALDKAGRLYVVDSMNFRIQVIDPDNEEIGIIGEQGGGYGQFSRPKGVAVDSDGNVYVSDAAFGNVQMFDPAGALLLVIGKPGGHPGEFLLPADMTVDAQDRIYIADLGNKRIQIFQYLGKPDLEEPESNESDQ